MNTSALTKFLVMRSLHGRKKQIYLSSALIWEELLQTFRVSLATMNMFMKVLQLESPYNHHNSISILLPQEEVLCCSLGNYDYR